MPCVLCEAAPHEPCETYDQVHVSTMVHDEGAVISVCLEHYRVIDNAIREQLKEEIAEEVDVEVVVVE